MIIRNGKELKERYWGRRAIQYVYKGALLVWSAISSCFGSGIWYNDKVWNNNDPWKN